VLIFGENSRHSTLPHHYQGGRIGERDPRLVREADAQIPGCVEALTGDALNGDVSGVGGCDDCLKETVSLVEALTPKDEGDRLTEDIVARVDGPASCNILSYTSSIM